MQLAHSDHAPPDQTEMKTLDLAIQPKTKKSTKTSALSRGKKKKGGSLIIAMVKMARPLNSWIAFRSYYAVIFITMPQKVISRFLTHLWQADPTKAKWTILAKAYSKLRDKVGKKKAPLPPFLAINAPFIGLVDPDDYLRIHGWELIDRDGQTILRRTARPDGAAYGSSMLTTNASVEDVIHNSCHYGYINESDLGSATLSSGMSLIMATSAQPVGYPSFGGFPIFNINDTASTNDEAGGTASQAEASNLPNGYSNVWETAEVNPGRNGIGAGLVDDANIGEGFSHQAGFYDLDLNEELGAGFEPDLDISLFKNDQFGAFNLWNPSNSNAADRVNNYAF